MQYYKVKISGVVCVLVREQGAEQLFKENNITFRWLFKHSHFNDYLDKVKEKRKLYQQKQNNKLEVQSVPH